MALDKVTKVEITAHNSIMNNLLEELQELSVLQIDPHSIEKWETEKEKLEETEESILDYRSRIQKIERAISFLDPYLPPVPLLISLSGNLPVIDKKNLQKEAEQKNADKIVETAIQYQIKLSDLNSSIRELEQKRMEMFPLSNISVPLSVILNLQKTKVIVSKIDSEKYNELLDKITSDLIFIEKISEGDVIYFYILYHLSETKTIEELMRTFRFDPISLNVIDKTPRELIVDYEEEIKRLRSEKEELIKKIKELASGIDAIRCYYDFLCSELEKHEVKKKFFFTKKTFVINGWIKKRDFHFLEDITKKYKEVFVKEIEKKKEEEPPVVYKNNRLVSPFELIVNLYSPPSPNEIDPTPILMPFYAIFFGICLTEAGYGLVIILLTALALAILKPRGVNRKFITLFLILGVFTFVIGTLMGTVFGIDFEQLPQNLEWLKKARYKVMIFDSSKDVLTFFGLALGLGIIHLITGYFIKMYMLFRDGDWAGAVCDHLPWVFLLLSPVPKMLEKIMPQNAHALNMAFYILIGLWAGITLLFSERKTWNPLKRIGIGLFRLYDVSSVLADVLSYSRLLALGLATGVIAHVMNTLAKMVNQIPVVGIIGFVLVLVVGHMFNLLISGLGAFVHSIRLQYMEFFTKFYTGGGVLFEPFTEKRKYTNKPELIRNKAK
ncbi:MAG: hypothetical protein DRP84_05810 [Spirochaetes bacterium]|nr:MAG: hypothetical protein DRP84_05810 [Spirochaetota bacterium]